MPRSVLIADDVADIRLIISLVLADEEDFVVVGEAGTGLEALEKTRELGPDVILLDLNMPQRNGLDVLPDLRTSAPHAKIVVFSGFQEASLGARALELGADDYIEKGTSVDEIVARIRTLTT